MTGREPGLTSERKGGPRCSCLAKRDDFDSVLDTAAYGFAQAVQVLGVAHRRIAFQRVQAIEDGLLDLGVPSPQAVGQQNSRLPP